MPGALKQKFDLWRDSEKGFKTRFHPDLNESAIDREDIKTLDVEQQIERGDLAQELRLRYYPTIDVNKEDLLVGHLEGDIDKAEKFLRELGFRNNPTAYVEVTEDGPDDGSYSRQMVTEEATGIDLPQMGGFVNPLTRIKDQIHVVIQKMGDRVDFMAHREESAWLQPVRHIAINDASAQRGVRDFRDIWYDRFEKEMPGKGRIKWDVTH